MNKLDPNTRENHMTQDDTCDITTDDMTQDDTGDITSVEGYQETVSETISAQFLHICCDKYSTIGLTVPDGIWGCGDNHLNQLGLRAALHLQTNYWRSPNLSAACQTTSGRSQHSPGSPSAGSVKASRGYAWRSGVSNQLCFGEEVQEVVAPVPLQTISVGGQHTLVLVDPSPALRASHAQ
ncbi:Regulator of chromosome condensation [Branchiostoma belcheri]|nr:Regulator of chromosome condensation [Branchiostoma belcheri]